jgi:hypothetical protein
MATASTNYLPGAVQTQTNAPGYSSGDDSMIDFWNQMARRRVEARPTPARKFGGFGRGSAPVVGNGGGPAPEAANNLAGIKEGLMRAELQKARAQAAALSGRIPTRIHPGGAGFTGAFSTPDHLAMSGAQRQMFLPQNSEQVGGFNEIDPAEDDFLINMRRNRSAGPGQATR